MSNKIPSFTSGAKLIIRFGTARIAFATSLSFSDNMSNSPVAGIGSFSPTALEPLQYATQGSMTITHYSSVALKKNLIAKAAIPQRVDQSGGTFGTQSEGNSLLIANFFSPAYLMLSESIDIDVYERTDMKGTEGELLFTVKDARLISYSISFMPGSLVQENVGFKAMQIIDAAMKSPTA